MLGAFPIPCFPYCIWMDMRKLKIFLWVILVIFLIVGIFFGVLIKMYERGELMSHTRLTTHCYLLQISIKLIDLYKRDGFYPNSEYLVDSMGEVINDHGCGASNIAISNGRMLDSFQSPICYEYLSEHEIVIHSINLPFIDYDKVTQDFSGFKLSRGSIFPHKVNQGSLCK